MEKRNEVKESGAGEQWEERASRKKTGGLETRGESGDVDV